MDPVAKVLILIGILFVLVGVLWQSGMIQALRLGRLPGDIVIEQENYRFYFPLVTSLILSAILSGILWLIRRL